MKALTPAEVQLLESLARYRLLTPQQAERLGIANITHARERLRSLHTAGMVHVTQRGRLAGPNVYVLSHRGAKALQEWTEGQIEARGRKQAMQATEHLNQRVCIVDTHISLRLWAEEIGAAVNWVRVEFDANPGAPAGRPAPITAAEHAGITYTPDMIASVTSQDGRTWLFMVEVETGGATARLSHFQSLLEARMLALKANVLENALSWPKDGSHMRGRMLFVFKDQEMLERATGVIERFSHDQLEGQLKRVFLNSLPLDFSQWWNLGEMHSPLRELG